MTTLCRNERQPTKPRTITCFAGWFIRRALPDLCPDLSADCQCKSRCASCCSPPLSHWAAQTYMLAKTDAAPHREILAIFCRGPYGIDVSHQDRLARIQRRISFQACFGSDGAIESWGIMKACQTLKIAAPFRMPLLSGSTHNSTRNTVSPIARRLPTHVLVLPANIDDLKSWRRWCASLDLGLPFRPSLGLVTAWS